MKSAIQEGASWTRGRFLGVVGVLFVLQAGLLFLFGDRSGPRPNLPASSIHFRALGASVSEDQLMRHYFVGDPAVFPLPNPHGFSGRSWLAQRPLAYQAENQLEPPSWLPLDPARLGANFPVLPPGDEPLPLELAQESARPEAPLPLFLAPELIATQSVFRLEGGLSDRLLGAAPELTNWPSPQVLTNTTVGIAVNSAGEVIVTRLKASCGWDSADADALAKARALRFRPSPLAGTRWGEVIFQWQTTEPASVGPPK